MLFWEIILARFETGLLLDVQNVIADKRTGVHSSLIVA